VANMFERNSVKMKELETCLKRGLEATGLLEVHPADLKAWSEKKMKL
jgi:hypothetical protein